VNRATLVFVIVVVLNYTPTYVDFISIWFFGRKGFKNKKEEEERAKQS